MCDGFSTVAMIAMAAASAASAMAASEQQRQQQEHQSDLAAYQASVDSNNAQAMRYQADNEIRKGEIEQEKVNRERDQLRTKYEAEAGANRSLLAASGVDMASGSAADMLMGNANYFAGDVQVNRYNHAIAGWDAGERAKNAEFQAAQYGSKAAAGYSNASWLQQTSGSLGTSLLTAGLKGASTGLSMYSSMGGFSNAGQSALTGTKVGQATGTGGGYIMPGGRVSGL